MKLQIAFDIIDLDKALELASETSEHADILEVGSLLIYKYGEQAVHCFKEKFPHKAILADAKLVDKPKEATQLFVQAGADWITVMAGATRNVIHGVSQTAHELGKKVMLDLLDASSLGQSALEAKSLGVDAILFHRPYTEDTQITLSEQWDMVKGNTNLPIYIAAPTTKDTIHELLRANPTGVVISSNLISSLEPEERTSFLRSIVDHN